MDKHWNAYCGLSLVHFLAFPEAGSGDGPILQSIAQIAEDDFFWGIEVSRINDPEQRRAVAQLVAQTHLTLDFGAHPMILGGKLNLNSLDSTEREQALSTLEPYLEQAAELGARSFAVLSGRDPGPAERAEATKLLIDSLRRLGERARTYKLNVVLETFDREVDKKALIGPSDEAAAIAATLRHDFADFGLLYDQAHGLLLNEEPLEALTTLKDFLLHVHVGNCVKVPGRTGYGDLHPRFGYPGGENDVAQLAGFIEALFRMGYLGEHSGRPKPGVGFELKPQPGETSTAILANLKRAWSRAWPMVSTRAAAPSGKTQRRRSQVRAGATS
jgi:sugar phosphate isomerase/epimerase